MNQIFKYGAFIALLIAGQAQAFSYVNAFKLEESSITAKDAFIHSVNDLFYNSDKKVVDAEKQVFYPMIDRYLCFSGETRDTHDVTRDKLESSVIRRFSADVQRYKPQKTMTFKFTSKYNRYDKENGVLFSLTSLKYNKDKWAGAKVTFMPKCGLSRKSSANHKITFYPDVNIAPLIPMGLQQAQELISKGGMLTIDIEASGQTKYKYTDLVEMKVKRIVVKEAASGKILLRKSY